MREHPLPHDVATPHPVPAGTWVVDEFDALQASVRRLGVDRHVVLPSGGSMEQRLSLVTLGVADIGRARAFYEQLGWRGQEVEETVFFQAGSIGIVLWGRDKLAEDSGIEDASGDGFGGIALAHNVRSPAEVDAVVAAAGNAGATITRPPRPTLYGGYAGCFTDPDSFSALRGGLSAAFT